MPQSDLKILLVDDEPRLLAGLRRRLSSRFTILTAENTDQALTVLEQEPSVAVVLTDMRMPGRDGIELLLEVSKRWPDIRRLMLTGNDDQETAIAAVNKGRVFRFFRKPVDADQLAAAFDEAIEEYRFVSGGNAERQALEVKASAGARSRKAFLSTMSHELLTPLNHILGFSSMLELKLRDKAEIEALEYLGYIKDSGEMLLRLVQRVLEIVRFTSGDPGREKQVVELRSVIAEELNQIRERADERNISVSFQTPPDPVFTSTNGYELRFALRELLDNAIKFNNPGGHISVAITADPDRLTLRVADTGIGMSEDTVARALSIFRQGEEMINRRFGGIGLGLTFVAFYANANNGRLTIESEEGDGTAVMLSMPCAERSSELARIAG